MGADEAEAVALRALAWLAGEEDLLRVFLGASGASPADLAARAGEPEFLVAVLDFLLLDDAWITAFCDAEGLSYETPAAARRALPGGAELHWT
ncbi:DUF3572 domain-containing protein [Meinhardsimonia xiamenensis]|nr:DUF3572 domain-containing protein [Meinhardsimonia xiamenensis]